MNGDYSIGPDSSVAEIIRKMGYVFYLDLIMFLLMVFQTLQIIVYSPTPIWLFANIACNILSILWVLTLLFCRKTSFFDVPYMGMAAIWRYHVLAPNMAVLFLRTVALPLIGSMLMSVIFLALFYICSIQYFLYQWKQIKKMMKILPFENKLERGIHNLHWKLWCYNCDKHLGDRETES